MEPPSLWGGEKGKSKHYFFKQDLIIQILVIYFKSINVYPTFIIQRRYFAKINNNYVLMHDTFPILKSLVNCINYIIASNCKIVKNKYGSKFKAEHGTS